MKPGPKVYKNGKKKCNCPIHQGKYVPLDQFWIIKRGPRKGLPLSRCVMGERIYKRLNPEESGLIPWYRVEFIFHELSWRIGKTETLRRIGASPNLWYRHEKGYNFTIRKVYVKRAIVVLRELRENSVARHKHSIRHGATVRGRREKIPVDRKDFNGPDTHASEVRRNWSKSHPGQDEITHKQYRENRRARKLTAGAITE